MSARRRYPQLHVDISLPAAGGSLVRREVEKLLKPSIAMARDLRDYLGGVFDEIAETVFQAPAVYVPAAPWSRCPCSYIVVVIEREGRSVAAAALFLHQLLDALDGLVLLAVQQLMQAAADGRRQLRSSGCCRMASLAAA